MEEKKDEMHLKHYFCINLQGWGMESREPSLKGCVVPKKLKTAVLELTNFRLLDKVSSLVHFDCFSSLAWFFALSVYVFK